jgi:hypothetical protein
MPTLKEGSEEKFFLIKKMGKLYLYLLILGRLVFVIERISLPEKLPMNSNIIDISKFMIQSAVGNEFVKSIFFLSLVLYSMFVAIESFMVVRDWILSFYSKLTSDKLVEKE